MTIYKTFGVAVIAGTLACEQIAHGDEKHIHQEADTDAPRQMSRTLTMVTTTSLTYTGFGPGIDRW